MHTILLRRVGPARIGARVRIGCGNSATGSGEMTDIAPDGSRLTLPRVSHTAVIITVAYSIAVILGAPISFAVFRSTARPLEEDRSGDVVAARDDVARDHDRRPLRAPDGDDLLRPLRRLGRPATRSSCGHRRAVRLGDRRAAAARHRHVPSSSARAPATSRTASVSTTPTTSSSSRRRSCPTTCRRSSTPSRSRASTRFAASSSAARGIT